MIDTTGLEPKRRAGRRALAERHGVPTVAVAGTQTTIAGLGDADAPESVRRFAEAVAAFSA